MKKIRQAVILLLIVIILTGVCGCMTNQNEELTVENLKNYATVKYSSAFSVVAFQAAKDQTYTNILTLSDGRYLFNVYQSADTDAADDYPQSVVNGRLLDDLRGKTNTGHQVFANFIFANGGDMTLDYAKESGTDTIVGAYSLLKMVVVVVVEEDISQCGEALFDIYQAAMAYEPMYIDFEVIKADRLSEDLELMLKDLPAFYDSDWGKHSEIKDWLRIKDTTIASADALLKGGM